MEIGLRKEKDIVIAFVTGRMDAVTAPEFNKTILDLISKGEKTFLINLAGLNHISSAGLRCILVLAKRINPEKGEIIFTGLHGAVKETFHTSGFLSIFRTYDSEEAALKSF